MSELSRGDFLESGNQFAIGSALLFFLSSVFSFSHAQCATGQARPARGNAEGIIKKTNGGTIQ